MTSALKFIAFFSLCVGIFWFIVMAVNYCTEKYYEHKRSKADPKSEVQTRTITRFYIPREHILEYYEKRDNIALTGSSTARYLFLLFMENLFPQISGIPDSRISTAGTILNPYVEVEYDIEDVKQP